jgi:hypothetical protein
MLNLLVALVVAFQSRPGLVPDRLIVGRAACGGSAFNSTFILTETPELIEISRSRTVSIHPVQGLAIGDELWGLACLSDGSLWMLAGPRVVVRVGREGRVRERVNVPLPRVGLFGAGPRLLVQQMPILAGGPVLVATPPRQPENVRPWPGLVARSGRGQAPQMDRNLVSCGLGFDAWTPCWFADGSRVVVSDGATSRSLTWHQPIGARFDRAAPIWDVALTSGHRYWLLATKAPPASGGSRIGGRLFLARENAHDGLSLDLVRGARLIVAASASRCTLLTVDGRLIEVRTTS